ncbi:MAG: protein translocase subunit SecF [Acidobacteria bacterium]|nr:protein translocase subunit SecF [Acidobacteriota bacterium]
MQIFRDTNFDFMGNKWPLIGLSLLLTAAGLVSLVIEGGPRYGIDFKGGTLLYVKFAEKPSEESIRAALGKKIPGEISVISVQGTNELMIETEIKDERELQSTRQAIEDTLAATFGAQAGKLDFTGAAAARVYERLNLPLQKAGVFISDEDLRKLVTEILSYRDKQKGGILSSFDELSAVPGMTPQILTVIKQEGYIGKYLVRNTEVVGPKVGNELRTQALLATLYALAGMLIYVGLRFEFVYGFAAVIAVFHDTIITIGLFSLFHKEISLTVIAALLTLVGYSMNDTIVVFDRIRENLQRGRKGDMTEIVNRSINETLSRTIMTSGLTFLTAVALWLFGGQVLNGFAFALVVGILVGTYSSIFVASPILVFWQDFMKKRGENQKTGGAPPVVAGSKKLAAK